ncbi:MAG: GntR family transcriptional regulator [Mycoplasmatales bacterium]
MLKRNNPLYMQIRDIIRNRIIDGEYELESYLPTELEFVDEFDVSLVTVRKAIELLQADHYVKKMSGKGTLVINNKIVSRLSTGATFSQILEKNFAEIEKQTVECVCLKDEANPFKTKKYTRLKRCYYVDGKPYIYMINYIATDISNEEFTSLYEALHKKGYQFARFNDKFSVSLATEEIKQILEVDSHVLKRERTTFLENGEKIEIAISYYNTEITEYEFEFLTQ